jgi:hypothetical protein
MGRSEFAIRVGTWKDEITFYVLGIWLNKK